MRRSLVSLALCVATFAGCGNSDREVQAQDGPVASLRVAGRVIGSSPVTRTVQIADRHDSIWTLVAEPDAAILDEAGVAIPLGALLPTFDVEVVGIRAMGRLMVPDTITVVRSPTIILSEPADGDTLQQFPLRMIGFVRAHNGPVHYRVYGYRTGGQYEESASGVIVAHGPPIGRFAAFQSDFHPESGRRTALDADSLRLEVFALGQDGLEGQRLVRTIPLRLPRTVSVYFSNDSFDSRNRSCSTVYPIARTIPRTARTSAIIRALLAGPTEAEKAQGYRTAIPEGTHLTGIRIAGGVAYVDFAGLEAAGSCRVLAVRAQIEQTLMANLRISTVVISVGGRAAEALQP